MLFDGQADSPRRIDIVINILQVVLLPNHSSQHFAAILILVNFRANRASYGTPLPISFFLKSQVFLILIIEIIELVAKDWELAFISPELGDLTSSHDHGLPILPHLVLPLRQGPRPLPPLPLYIFLA